MVDEVITKEQLRLGIQGTLPCLVPFGGYLSSLASLIFGENPLCALVVVPFAICSLGGCCYTTPRLKLAIDNLPKLREWLLKECEKCPEWGKTETDIKEFLKKERIGKVFSQRLGYNPFDPNDPNQPTTCMDYFKYREEATF